MPHATTEIIGQKRKAGDEETQIEINLNAPEPASKKALRKARKSKITSENEVNIVTDSKAAEGGAISPNAQDGGRSRHGIWVGNLPYTTEKNDLLTFLTSDDTHLIKPESISRINLPTNAPKHGKPQNKGFAYVDFTAAEDLEKALQLSEKLFLGRRVLIKNAKSFEGRPSSTATSEKEAPDRPPNSRIFVGNLGFDTTVEDLETHFQTCGPVSNVHMATFEDSGKCKGYAWIEFEQLSSAESAMRGWVEIEDPPDVVKTKSGKRRIWVGRIEGRKLRMEYAEDRTTRYNKRFGKGTQDAGDHDKHPKTEDAKHTDTIVTTPSDRHGKAIQSAGAKTEIWPSKAAKGSDQEYLSRPSRRMKGKSDSSGYARETVERLRGSIVPGEGKRVTFD